jgi:hypothetical protein
VLVTVIGGVALACVLAAAAMLSAAFNSGARQMNMALLLGLGALCSLLGAVLAIGGAGEPRWRWALPGAAIAYAAAAAFSLTAPGGNILALAGATLALLTPWWSRWLG